jgi:hypothetical protein
MRSDYGFYRTEGKDDDFTCKQLEGFTLDSSCGESSGYASGFQLR